MSCQSSKVRFFLSKAASLANHHPERTICMIFYEILINSIVLQIQSGTEHTAENPVRLCVFQSADCRHNSHVQLCRGCRNFILCADFQAAVFRIKIGTIILDLFPHGRIRCKPHLIHPNGNQVCPELLTVKLHIQKPVIIQAVIDTRTVNQIIGGQIVCRKQFLYGKRIIASQCNHLCIFQNHSVQLILKFLIFIVPEDDTTLVKLRQRCSKSAV